MKKALLLVPVVLAAVLASTFLASPLDPGAVVQGEIPPAWPPGEMALFQLPTGVTHRSAAFAYRGGTFADQRAFSMTAVLVKHPRGDLLIDTGFGKDIDAHFETMPWAFRLVTRYAHTQSVAQQLDAAGYDRSALQAVILAHAHWDHVSGVPELGATPVWVTHEEHQFIRDGGFLSQLARSFADTKYTEYAFAGGAYLGFARSSDVYGDGAVVIVPAPGHTPGSVIVFVTLPTGRRYAFVGDLAWQREGILEREERPWVQRTLGDFDPAEVRENLRHMSAIAERFPDITIVPAHDMRGFVDIPRINAAPNASARSSE